MNFIHMTCVNTTYGSRLYHLNNVNVYIFIRYNPVLEAVVTCTEDLAYKQAKEADDLLAQGNYLGI